ncbi:MAG: general secretion pathway protein GspK [Gemmataceae bacterium]|nr:general secretion pathway protein GspK [Gemmataceae bacterium]
MKSPRRSGVVLLAVLVVVVLLSLAAYQYGELMTSELRAADSAIRAAQARSLAISGVHFAAASLADPSTITGQFNGNVYDNESAFRGVVVHPSDNGHRQGRFSLVAPPPLDDALNGSTASRFGVTDESGKININALVAIDSTGKIAHDTLIKLPNMTEEIADAIVDWIDADDEQRPSGAENMYYSGLSPGYKCKNGPLDTLEELLLVRGVTPQLLFGTDANRNGRTDASEADGNGYDAGWAGYLTVYSRELNRGSDNQPRIYINDRDLNKLYEDLNAAVGEELATWVVAYRLYGSTSGGGAGGGSSTNGGTLTKSMLDFNRRGSSISSLATLIDGSVTIPATGGGGSAGSGGSSSSSSTSSGSGKTSTTNSSSGNSSSGNSSGRGNSQGGGGGSVSTSKVFSSPLSNPAKRKTLLPLLYDKCSTRKDAEIPARVNINTAPQAVLAALPGLEESDVQTILGARPAPGSTDPSDPTYQSPAWIVTEANLPTSKLRTIERYVTARTQTYRVQSLGYFDQGGPVARVEAVIDTNGGSPRIIYFRDLTELGRGFEVPR